MLQLINKIDQLKAEYDSLLPMPVEARKKLDKKIRLEFNFNSNHIEGNTLNYGETELLLIFDETKGGHTMREYEEMKAHDVAFHLIQQWVEDPRPISEADIKNLNKVLLIKPYWKEAITPDGQPTRRQILVGEYKQHPNSVRLANGEMFEYTSPIDTPVLMGELVNWYVEQSGKKESHPLLLASLLHYRFVCIHPFDDGNGRVSRLLMNYALMKNGFPPVIIKSAEKVNYLRALNQADTGDTEAFIQYIGEQLVWSLDLCIKAAKGESLEEPDDLDKELTLLQRELQGKTTLKAKGTPDNIEEIILKSIIPMLKITEEKLQILRPSFFEFEREIRVSIKNDANIHMVGTINDPLDIVLKNWMTYNINKAKNPVGVIRYQFLLKGFKGGKNGRNFSVYVEINFGDYTYIIFDKHYPYGMPISPEEMQKIISLPIKNLIDQIKQST